MFLSKADRKFTAKYSDNEKEIDDYCQNMKFSAEQTEAYFAANYKVTISKEDDERLNEWVAKTTQYIRDLDSLHQSLQSQN